MATSNTQALNSSLLPPQYQQYLAQIEASAKKYGVDPAILAGLLVHEAGIDKNGVPQVSPAEAVGIAQFTIPTARAYGVNPYDAKSSIDGAAHYLSDNLKSTGGDYTGALAMYNEGGPQFDKYGLNGPPGNIYERPGDYAKKILDYAKTLTQGNLDTDNKAQMAEASRATDAVGDKTPKVDNSEGFYIGPWKIDFPKGPGGMLLSQYFMALIAGGILIIGGIAWLMKSEAQEHPGATKVAAETLLA